MAIKSFMNAGVVQYVQPNFKFKAFENPSLVKVRQSAARKGVNPRDQKPIQVPAKERVRFFPWKELADAVVKK